jgi:multicomponent Na+:H+ antiporter subunit E
VERKNGDTSGSTRNGAPAPVDARPHHLGQTVALFVILALFWILLSQRIGLQYFIFMLASIGIVLWLNPERPLPSLDPTRGRGLLGVIGATGRLVRYVVWLVWNVLKANIEVAKIILSPRLPINPRLVEFRTTLETELARVVVANSITLTPGTVTIDLLGERYLVHALHPNSVSAVESGELQNVVGAIFGEEPDPPPELHWSDSFRDLIPE